MLKSIYSILDAPWVYNLAQNIFAPGAKTKLTRNIKSVYEDIPKDEPILDIGCGPASWLFEIGIKPVGLDLEPQYIEAYKQHGSEGHLGSADALPFDDESFQSIWCIGVFHHLPDEVVQKSLAEALRVCKKGGHVTIFDAVLPKSVWHNPFAYGIRKLDRGEFMRKQDHLISLFPEKDNWQVNRFHYTYTGLEMLSLSRIKQ